MYPINAVKTIGNAIVYVSFNISNGSSSFLLYNSIIIFQNNFLFHFTSHNQSLTNLIKNNPGDPININTYTETNKFTIPTDGYITIQFSSNSALHAANVMIYGSNGNGITSFGTVTNSNVPGNQQNVAVFVKKGMKCAVLNRSSAATVYYKPLA